MGGLWLHQLPDVIADAGLVVSTWQGWETRSRSSGGYDDVFAIGTHHDAGATGTPLDQRCRYAWESASDRPIGALWLHTDGQVVVGAAGATNTQGKGGPRQCSRGTIPLDQGNRYMLSIEASNNGVGEPWPTVMQDAYVALCHALMAEFDLSPGDVVAHFEWTNRKIDPAGNSRYATGGASWNMDAFRGDVWLYNPAPTPTPPDPQPTPMGDDDMIRADYGVPGTDDWWARMLIGGVGITWVQGHANDGLDTLVPGHLWVQNDQHMLDLLATYKAIGPAPSTWAGNQRLRDAWAASAAK